MLDTIETISAKQFCFLTNTADPFLCILALEARYGRREVANAHGNTRYMRGSRKFCQRGSDFARFALLRGSK